MSRFILLFFISFATSFRTPHLTVPLLEHGDDPGSPLILTPYIEQGNIEEARNLSYVQFPDFPNIKSYAGFFTVDKKYDSNQFFWYFPAESERTTGLKTALYLWLDGGPGCSSLSGLFSGNGVFEVVNNTFHRRELSWSKHDHVIYIDNPVGAGFSYTNDSRGYCTNETQVGEHLYSSLMQFFQLFPELLKYDFIISGESYAGKYIPALGYTIHKKNPTAKIKINLMGLMIGDGLSDPVNQLDYAAYLYQTGLIDWNQKNELGYLEALTAELIEKKAWHDASSVMMGILKYVHTTAKVNIFNFLNIENNINNNYYTSLIQKNMYRKAIHVGNLNFKSFNKTVHASLIEDIPQSVAPWISELLEHYHMLFYNGQVDIIVPYPLTLNFLRKLEFSGSEDYIKARRDVILYKNSRNETLVGGYVKASEYGKLMDALVRVAGHNVVVDQPVIMLALMETWRLHCEKQVPSLFDVFHSLFFKLDKLFTY